MFAESHIHTVNSKYIYRNTLKAIQCIDLYFIERFVFISIGELCIRDITFQSSMATSYRLLFSWIVISNIFLSQAIQYSKFVKNTYNMYLPA